AEAAQAEAVRMKQEAEQAAQEAARQKAEAEKASAAALAQQQAAQADAAQAARDRAAAQAETEKARQAAAQAEAEKAQLRAQLLAQLNSILQTRDSARGLIVNMSDVLFDTGSHTLSPAPAKNWPRFQVFFSRIPASRCKSKVTPTALAATNSISSFPNAEPTPCAIFLPSRASPSPPSPPAGSAKPSRSL